MIARARPQVGRCCSTPTATRRRFAALRPAGRGRRRRGLRRAARRRADRHGLGARVAPRPALDRDDRDRHAVLPARSGRPAARGGRARGGGSRLRRLRRPRPPGVRPLAGAPGRTICAARCRTRRSARSTSGPRATASPWSISRPSPSTRSSTPTARRTSPRPSGCSRRWNPARAARRGGADHACRRHLPRHGQSHPLGAVQRPGGLDAEGRGTRPAPAPGSGPGRAANPARIRRVES